LDAAEREFWLMISQAAFTNPFSDQRYELDLKIAGKFDRTFNVAGSYPATPPVGSSQVTSWRS